MSIFTKFIGQRVLIRSYGSGVHFGILEEVEQVSDRFACILSKSRRIHYWEGAASCSEIAISGIKTGRVAMELPQIGISDGLEIIPISEAAIQNLQNQPVWRA